MGFYGNIRNATSNSFKFDRIYSNRVMMENNADIDGVFGGRYVLVEYDQPLKENPGDVNTVYKKYHSGDNKIYYEEISLEKGYLEKTEEGILQNPVYYIKFDGEVRDDDLPTKVTGVFVPGITYVKADGGEKETTSPSLETTALWIKEEGDEEPTEIQVNCYVSEELVASGSSNAKIELLFDEWYVYDEYGTRHAFDAANEDAYTINYTIDKSIYGIGRGYDSTVWRKVYSNEGKAKYVMIAELNSVVPTFAISGDAPSDIPQVPHFDKDSTNVYYNLHLQTPWGFRIADVSDVTKSAIAKELEDIEYKSDFNVSRKDQHYDSSGHYIIDYNDTDGETTDNDYPGALFVNLEGFNKEASNHSQIEKNEIRIDNYKSGRKYNNRRDPENYEKEEYDDVKELSIILPAIGNTVADMWDLIYGNGEIIDDKKTNERQLDTKWDDANHVSDLSNSRLRLVHDKFVYQPIDRWEFDPNQQYYFLDSENVLTLYEGSTYEDGLYKKTLYARKDADTLAGAINSVHDLMGMIITEDTMPEDANNAHTWQIYYDTDTDKYYYAAETVDIVPISYDSTTSTFTSEDGEIEAVVKTAAEFETQFSNDDNADNYSEITNLLDLKKYARETETPIFTNSNNGNVYKVVSETIDAATPNALYYELPTSLDPVTALMNAGDTKEWYYEFEEQREEGGETKTITGYKNLPDEDKAAAVSNDTTYYWVDWKVATLRGQDQTKAFVLDSGALFKRYKLSQENIPYDEGYVSLSSSTWQKYYDGDISSWDAILEAEGIEEGMKNDFNYDISKIYFEAGTYNEPEYDEEGNIIGYIVGKLYKAVNYNEILFANAEEKINTYYYKKNNIVPVQYEKKSWTQILAENTLASGEVEYKFKIDNIQPLRRESECYYVIFKQTADALQKKQEFEQYVDAHLDEKLENFAEYIPYIAEFNRSTSEDGFNDNYKYFLSEAPTPVGYGIGSKYNPNELTYADKLFFTDNTLYFKDENNIFRKANKINNYAFVEGNTLYRKLNSYCILNAGEFEEKFNPFEDLNAEIIRSDKDVENGINTDIINYFGSNGKVVLGYRVASREWKELYGFARNINTLHGLLLKINDVLQTDDYKTRDRSTIQGCINTLNDIFEKFDELIPGELYGVNKYGRLDAVNKNGESGSGKWIDVETSINEDTGKLTLDITHFTNTFADDNEYTPSTDTTLVSGKEYYIPSGDNTYKLYDGTSWISGLYEKTTKANSKHNVFGLNDGTLSSEYAGHKINDIIRHNSSTFTKDTIEIITPVIDNAGHVVGEKKTNFDLPLNFNGISLTGASASEDELSTTTGNITPDNCADILNIKTGNKWIRMAHVDGKNDDDETNTDVLTVAHLLSGVTNNSTVTTVQPNNLAATDYSTTSGTQSFSIPYFTVDKAGHMTTLENRHINLFDLHLGGTDSVSNTDELNINGTQTLKTALQNIAASINTNNYVAPTEQDANTHSYSTTPIAANDGVNKALQKLQSQINDIKYNNNYTSNGSKEHFAFIYRQLDEPTGAYTGHIWIKGDSNPQPAEVREIYIFNGVQWELLNAWQ